MGNGRGGKRPGSGRPGRAKELGLIATLEECYTPDERKALFLHLKKLRKSKSEKIQLEAAKLELAYLYGTPRQTLEVSGPGGGPVEHRVFDYATAVTAVAPGPTGDSPPSGSDQDSGDGPAVG